MSRRDELAENLAAVRDRIARACKAVDRPTSDLTLIVVTKTYPASDVALLHELGVSDIGENRHPEAGRKKAELGPVGDQITWHFVGTLQSNKVGPVARYADVVHSVDRPELVDRLGAAAARNDRTIDCFVQVNLDRHAEAGSGRSGCSPALVPGLADDVAATAGLRLRGLMAVAPLGVDPVPAFADLADLSAAVVRDHRSATSISAGMSDDLEAAIAAGATHVRIGRSVLGERPPLR